MKSSVFFDETGTAIALAEGVHGMAGGTPLPPALASVPLQRLRLVGGDIVATDPAPMPLDVLRARAAAQVDALAEAARLAFITPGAGQALVYEAKRDEVLKWRAAGEPAAPAAADYPWAARRATRLAVTIAAVLTEWSARVDAWADAGQAIEDIREQAKEDVAAAADETAIAAILAALVWFTPS
jgi:hypothetical protein